MESLIADFVQFSSTIAKFLFLEGRLGTRREGKRERSKNLHSTFRFFYNFLPNILNLNSFGNL